MSIIDTLITDRVEADTERLAALNAAGWDAMTAEEQTLWSAGKGAYNAGDLNRVGAAAAYVYGVVTAMGYAAPGYTALRTDWGETDIPTAAELRAYLASIAALQALFGGAPFPLPAAITGGLSTEDANNIESALRFAATWAELIEQSFVYSGQTRSGIVWTQLGG